MPGVGLIRSKLRPSRWLSPKSKQSFTKRRLLITASSKSFSARCANSVSKSSSDRHRESANAPAANIPKVPYFSAIPFQGLVRQILSKSEGEVSHWRHAMLGAVGTNGQLVVNLIPELELHIGKQSPLPELPPQEAQNRFDAVLRRFIGAFARKEHPLALFLDDLQWMDPASLKLLEQLVTHPEIRHLLVIGAYRDNEVTADHPLILTLDAIRRTQATVIEIVLRPLSLEG